MTGSLVGMQLGKYRIRAEIGKGGMGIVHQSNDPLPDQEKAIKVLAPHLVWEPGFVERSLREARSAARSEHTHDKLIDRFGPYRRQVELYPEPFRALGQVGCCPRNDKMRRC